MKITSINFHQNDHHGMWFGTATDGRNLLWFYDAGILAMESKTLVESDGRCSQQMPIVGTFSPPS